MKKYVLHIKGWVILNANVPIDIINSSEVECVKLNFSYSIILCSALGRGHKHKS